MKNRTEMDQFLASVQNRAYQMAKLALQHEEDALDAVQDAMIKLVDKYADKPAEEWKPLFYRILQSRIYDVHRKNTVKQKVFGFFGMQSNQDEAEPDLHQDAEDLHQKTPEEKLQLRQVTAVAVDAVQQLPVRQQQAFMLRIWEGLSVAETATAMAVSEGSVKTHLSRAVAALKNQLEDHWQ